MTSTLVMIIMMMMVMMIMIMMMMVAVVEIFLNNGMNSMFSYKVDAAFSFFFGSKAFSVAKNFAIWGAKVPMKISMTILMYNKAIRHDSIPLNQKNIKKPQGKAWYLNVMERN